MKHILYFFIASLVVTGCKKDEIRGPAKIDLLSMAKGESKQGTAEHFAYNPYFNATYSKVYVDIADGNLDSSITIAIYYDDTLSQIHENIKLDAELKYYTLFGSTVQEGFLRIELGPSALFDYFYSNPCGTDCVKGSTFTVAFN